MNPELRRNVWLELTPHRLVSIPAILAAVFFFAFLVNDSRLDREMAAWAIWIFGVLALLWGTRVAAECVTSEIVGRTWDAQRMSSVDPWSMAWGKLLGATIHVWYGSAICVLVYMVAIAAAGGAVHRSLEPLALLASSALLAHCVSLMASLHAVHKHDREVSARGSGFFLLGLAAAGPYLVLGAAARGPRAAAVAWYGLEAAPSTFVLASAVAFTGWAVVGVHRLMRVEMQLPSRPWVWLAFTVFTMAYAAGFAHAPDGGVFDAQLGGEHPLARRLLLAYVAAVALVYVMVLLEPKSPVELRRGWAALLEGRTIDAAQAAPRWLLGLGVAGVAALCIVAWALARAALPWRLAALVLAAWFFVARDTALLLALNLGPKPRRADTAGVVYLMLLYGLAPALVGLLGLEGMFFVFLPDPRHGLLLAVAAPVIEAGALLFLVRARWRRLHRAGGS